jgi:hypothetical protein
MKMDPGVDTGPLSASRRSIDQTRQPGRWPKKPARRCRFLLDRLPAIFWQPSPQPQDESLATMPHVKEGGELDFYYGPDHSPVHVNPGLGIHYWKGQVLKVHCP